MEQNLNFNPSFIKLLMEDDFTREIRIPYAFVRNFKEKLFSRCTIESEAKNSVRNSWPVRIRKKGRYYYICKLSWPKFVKDHHLKLGDYLLFHLIDKTTFKVKPYGADCCPKKFNVHKSFSSSSDDESDDGSDDDSDETEFYGDDGIGPSKVHPARKKVYTKYQIDRDNFRSNKFRKLKKTRKSGVGKRVLEIESEDGEEVEANEMDGYFDLNAENPYFIFRLKQHHMGRLNIPRPFSRATKLAMEKEVVLRGEDQREWPVKINERSEIGKGWTEFRKAYKLEKGEICRFTLLARSARKNGHELLKGAS
ncbi:B3 domain-containing protein At5g18090-like [Coffea arabica]|uniref:B3 domain-containing protein At5g18090-like n=1 Tax=Coffea arabica TaxID=13443 RepID=A0A6P6TDR8_COFAR|nr:B3 domain-containing protein REM23-like [Coffea arabica]